MAHGGVAADDREEPLEGRREDRKVAVLERVTATGSATGRAAHGRHAVERQQVVIGSRDDARAIVEIAGESGGDGGDLCGVLDVVEEDGVEISADDGRDARLDNRLKDGAKNRMQALWRDRLHSLARLDKQDAEAFVTQLRRKQHCCSAEKLADRRVDLACGEWWEDGVHEVEEKRVSAVGWQEMECLGEDDVEKVAPRLEGLVARELYLAPVVLDDERLDNRTRFLLRLLLLLGRVEQPAVLQLPPSGAQESKKRAKVVRLATSAVPLQARVEAKFGEQVEAGLVRRNRVVPGEVERVKDLEHARESLLEAAVLLEESRHVVVDGAGVLKQGGDELARATSIVAGREDAELERRRVEQPAFGLEDGANGRAGGDDLLAVGVLYAADRTLRRRGDGERKGEGLAKEELLAIAEVAGDDGGGVGLKAELANEAVTLRGEGRMPGEQRHLFR